MTDHPYDRVPYPSGAFPQTHPDRLATIATLFGMSPPAIDRGRVLELGCASGGNLLPMACALPEATFVGIDSSAVEIGEGQRQVAAFGLGNLSLRQQDLRDLEPEPGSFDYVICHGVYSWVGPEVRQRILAICARALSPQGVAYVSYNAYPGNYFRQLLRDTMRLQTAVIADPRERVAKARSLAAFLAGAAPASNPIYATILKGELERLGKLSDEVLLHDDLSDTCQPFYFHEFAAAAAGHGLRYLGEALFADMQSPPIPPAAREALARAGDLVTVEQIQDVLRCRAFRQTLLCRAEVELVRKIDPGTVARLQVVATAKSAERHPEILSANPDRYTNREGITMGLVDPLHKAAMSHLLDTAPAAASLDDLLLAARKRLAAAGATGPEAAPDDDRRSLCELVLQAYGGDMVELHRHPTPLVVRPGERPAAGRAALLQAGLGSRLSSLRHQNVVLDEPFALHLLRQLDGTLDRAQLTERMTQLLLSGAVDLEPSVAGLAPSEVHRRVSDQIEPALARMGRLALLSA